MSKLARLTREGDVAIVTIDNPPVNTVSPGVPEAIIEAVERIEQDPEIRAVVMTGAGRTFVAGADIKVFEKIASGELKIDFDLLPFLLRIENCTKPVVIAIHGLALGGGLELAIAGHYRIALSSAQLGQPEVKLGLIPGMGGTQRLPRLVGVANALRLCVKGETIGAAEALAMGLVDRVVESSLLVNAVEFARDMALHAVIRTRDRNEDLNDGERFAQAIAEARESLRLKKDGLLAPVLAIDAIEASRLPFAEGCEVEQRLFQECLHSEQAKALMHVFFGEREVAKIAGISKDTPLIPFERIAIVGLETLDAGTIELLNQVGFSNTLEEAELVVAIGDSIAAGGSVRLQFNGRLMETLRGATSTASEIATFLQLAKRLGRIGVVTGPCDGFVGDRMAARYKQAANSLVSEGVSAEAINKALKEFGMSDDLLPAGPAKSGQVVEMSQAEILEQCIGALAAEGQNLLETGCALRPVDIDMICVAGYGFPAHRGGPMWYASRAKSGDDSR